MKFKDHFSTQSADYAKFRPTYPRELFRFLAEAAPSRGTVWDCATGNGQAAIPLAEEFERVIATDASPQQIASAPRRDKIEFGVARAEESGIPARTIDLITVAQAAHWFDPEIFYAEARRVLRPGGVIALWGYQFLETALELDAIVNRYYYDIVGPYWPPERTIIEQGYADIHFPFLEIPAPKFEMKVDWSLEQLLGYLRSWSATQRYMAEKQSDPLALITADLQKAWGSAVPTRTVKWPLTIRVGRVAS